MAVVDLAKQVGTTKGDLYVYNGTTLTRLPVGSNDQVLKADSAQATGVKWAAESGGGGSSGLTSYGQPVSGRRLRMERVENQTVTGSTAHTLASVTGPGVITSVWMALNPSASSAGPFYDGFLRLYYDGEATPSFEVTLANLTAAVFGAGGTVRWACNRVQVEITRASDFFGFTFKFEAPFGTSVDVEYYNPSVDTQLWSQVYWSDGEERSYRLKSEQLDYANRTTVTSGSTYSLLSLASGTSGWLVFSSVFGDGVSNRSWMERDVELTIDGEATPSIASPGLEDWFLGSFYFQDRSFYATPTTMVGVNDSGSPYRTHAAIDLLETHGGIRFEDGIDVSLGTEAAVTTDFELVYALLWYEDV